MQTYQKILQEDVIYRVTLNVLSHESESQAPARVYLSSDIQVIKGSGSSGQVSIQFSPMVREVEL